MISDIVNPFTPAKSTEPCFQRYQDDPSQTRQHDTKNIQHLLVHSWCPFFVWLPKRGQLDEPSSPPTTTDLPNQSKPSLIPSHGSIPNTARMHVGS